MVVSTSSASSRKMPSSSGSPGTSTGPSGTGGSAGAAVSGASCLRRLLGDGLGVSVPAWRHLRPLHDLFELGAAHAEALDEHVERGQHAGELLLLRRGGDAAFLQRSDRLVAALCHDRRLLLIQNHQGAANLTQRLSRGGKILRPCVGEARLQRRLRGAQAGQDLRRHLRADGLRIALAQGFRLQAHACRSGVGLAASCRGQPCADCRHALLELQVALGPGGQRVLEEQQGGAHLDGDRAVRRWRARAQALRGVAQDAGQRGERRKRHALPRQLADQLSERSGIARLGAR